MERWVALIVAMLADVSSKARLCFLLFAAIEAAVLGF